MKLVMYGGGYFEDNVDLDLELIKLTHKPTPSLTYIPASSSHGEEDFREFMHHYENYEISHFHYFPVDEGHTTQEANEALKSDIIYLSGGNTFHLLHHLKKSGMLSALKAFAKKGGVLAGLSAGAIVMTPNIATAALPHFDCDENEIGLKDLTAMNLVPFEVFPHYEGKRRYDVEFKNHSMNLKGPLYAIADGAGIVVNEDKILFLGEAYAFFEGTKTKISIEDD